MISEKTVHLTYPSHLLNQPLIYHLIRHFDLLTNILKAQVTSESGWLTLSIRGDQAQLEAALAWIAEQGVQVEIITEVKAEL